MKDVRAKKHLGQHFLNDETVAENIVKALSGFTGYKKALEIGPGMGVLTKYLIDKKEFETSVVEIDRDSIAYLNVNYSTLAGRIYGEDFLKMDLDIYTEDKFGLIGNFPYNISSQIFFKVLANRDQIPEVVGMLQKEVAERICHKEGSKKYGILSVLLQTFYDLEYLFEVSPTVFTPPPKVWSAVVRLKRNDRKELPCDEKFFFKVVKQAFQTRRKTLWNALKVLGVPEEIRGQEVFNKRAEQLSVDQFVELTLLLEKYAV